MKDLIERYVYDVVRRLKEDQREEVARELHSNIDEMLSDNPTEKEIVKVLKELGHPRILANSYRGEARYLIGPEWYEDFLMVLKIVAIVFAAVALVSGVITHALNPDSESLFGVILEVLFGTIGDMIQAVFTGFAIVTIIFILIDRYTKKEGSTIDFDIKCLPELPDDKSRNISKLGTIISLVFNTVFGFVFLYLIYNNNLLLVWIENGEFNTSLPLFTNSVVMGFFVLLVLSFIANVSLDVFKLVKGQWTFGVTGYHTGVKILTSIISIIFINAEGLFNSAFIDQVANALEVTSDQSTNALGIGIIALSVLVVIGAISEISASWRKTLKYRRK